jgi:hypothetical protein
MKSPLRVAARVHYDLLRVFPFALDSGKVSRLLMNIILLRGGYPPAIVHSTERQRYYEALKGQLPVIIQLVNESIMNALASIEKRLDDEARAGGAPSAPASGAAGSAAQSAEHEPSTLPPESELFEASELGGDESSSEESGSEESGSDESSGDESGSEESGSDDLPPESEPAPESEPSSPSEPPESDSDE